jgi:hypothetical protein
MRNTRPNHSNGNCLCYSHFSPITSVLTFHICMFLQLFSKKSISVLNNFFFNL